MCRVFISLCLSEDCDGAAVRLRDALQTAGISTFLCNSLLGDDIPAAIANALDACELFVVLGTEGYGKQGDTGFSTKQELEFAIGHSKPICLIKRCDEFAAPLTRLYLPAGMLHQLWPPHTCMPPDLLGNVMAKLEAGGARASAAAVHEFDIYSGRPAVQQSSRCVSVAVAVPVAHVHVG
jgi:hypothetical protein